MKIEVLTLPECNPCKQLAQWLHDSEIDYKKLNALSDDIESVIKVDQMKGIGVKTVPAIWIDGEYFGAGREMFPSLKAKWDDFKIRK